jgi:hypothetical protein
LAEEGDPVARYGLVLLDEQTGQSGNEAERPRFQRLNEIYAKAPDTLIGVLAARRLGRTDARPQASEACQSVGRLAGQLPPLIRRIAQQPARVVTLEAEPEQTRLDYIEPLRMTFTLTNVSPIPLSLGAGGTVPATVLVRPRVTIGGRSGPILAPQVVDLDRRIRLQSGESLTVTTRLDLGPVAEVLRQNPVPEIELRFTATLNPRPAGGRDRYEPGLLGLRVPGGRVTRTGSPNTPDAVQRYLRTLSTAEPGESMRFAALLLQIVPSLPEAQADRVRQIAEAVRGVFEDASPAGRAWLLSHLPRTERHQQAFAPMYDAAVNAENPLPLQALLAAAVDREEMTVLNAALRRPDGEAARQFAERIRSIRQLRAEARQQPAEGGATSEAEGEQGDSGDGAADSGNGGG